MTQPSKQRTNVPSLYLSSKGRDYVDRILYRQLQLHFLRDNEGQVKKMIPEVSVFPLILLPYPLV